MSDHAMRLEKMLADRISERRAVMLGYAESADPVMLVEKVVAFQLQIEAIERAIEHEKRLDPPAADPRLMIVG